MTDTMISAAGLRFSYGSFEAVRGVDLAVRRGEVFALLGTNGAGKTSTLEVLRGHRRPAAGTVRVLGLDPARDRRRLAPDVGVVPQESGFAPGLTVAETFRLWVRLRGREPDTALLGEVGLDGRRRVAVRQLSGGERRRLDLAVALAGDPPLLLLDEPTTGLDPDSRERAWESIRRRAAAGATVLLTTHYLEEAERLADRLAVMAAGRVAVAGTPGEVTADRPYRIDCAVPARLRERPLPALAGVPSWRALPDRRAGLTVTTAQPEPDLMALRAWAGGSGLDRLTVTPPSLADVFREIGAAA